jgi:hypothetical protein
VRGLGSTRSPDPPSAGERRAGAEVPAQPRAQAQRPRGSEVVGREYARQDRARDAGASRHGPVRRRAHPLRSWLTLEQGLQSTGWVAWYPRRDRARLGASPGSAWPVPGVCSQRASHGWPAGWVRRHRPAALEQAQVSYAWPLCVPAGPARLPAESLAPLPSRPEETQACPRGHRALAGLAASRTQRRSAPLPGPGRSR